MSLKETLLNWIDVYIPSDYVLNWDNCHQFTGDPEEPFVNIREHNFRRKLIDRYIEYPVEESIELFLIELRNIETNSKIEKRAINKVLTRFGQNPIK